MECTIFKAYLIRIPLVRHASSTLTHRSASMEARKVVLSSIGAHQIILQVPDLSLLDHFCLEQLRHAMGS